MKVDIKIEEIQEFLPHRYPMLLVDRVIEMELGDYIVAYKNITTNEPTPFYESTQSITMGSDNIKTFSFANSMPIAPSLLFRFAIQQHSQDGFRINKFTIIK